MDVFSSNRSVFVGLEKATWDGREGQIQKSFRNPNPYWSRRKSGSTPPICTAACPRPPICIAGPSWLLSLKGKPNSTPPICTAVRLPFVRQYTSHFRVGVTGKFLTNGELGFQDPKTAKLFKKQEKANKTTIGLIT